VVDAAPEPDAADAGTGDAEDQRAAVASNEGSKEAQPATSTEPEPAAQPATVAQGTEQAGETEPGGETAATSESEART
jgi:hypothetical protein